MGNKGRFGLLSLVLTWTLALTVPAALLTVAPLTAEAAQTHEVLLLSRRVEGKPTPEFYFEPTGLYIEPGDTVRFVAVTPQHTVTAYHRDHGKVHRVPEGVEPFSSPVIPLNSYWEYTFQIPGVYDIWCVAHERLGHVMRLVVGEASGPAVEPPTDFGPGGTAGVAGRILSHPALAPETIIARGAVSWDDIPADAKTMSPGN